MVEILKDEVAKLETKQLYVFFQSAIFLLTSFSFALHRLIIRICDYRRLLGKDLTGLGFKELQHLEKQLNEGLSSVRDRKVLHI